MCEKCIWCGQCVFELECSDFTPADDDIDIVITEGREGFYREWNAYAYAMDT